MADLIDDPQQAKRGITLQLPNDVIAWIDRFRGEWGLRSRGDTVERLLRELFVEQRHNDVDDALNSASSTQDAVPSLAEAEAAVEFDEGGALVLIPEAGPGSLGADFQRSQPTAAVRGRSTGGIELPGFVRRQSEQLKRAVQLQPLAEASARDTFAVVDQPSIEMALEAARRHWLELYGTEANANVLEAAMIWLSRDIWPQADQSEGKPFTWSLACLAAGQLAPSWPMGEPSFERVMVMAGLLEDPYSGATLSLRIPTLIRRFVHRFRRRQRGMSFETLENTMSLHGALKLLQLPTTPGHRLTLGDIREAYREQAMHHHPDSGGDPEQMRRLNEAYQLLKELYRSP